MKLLLKLLIIYTPISFSADIDLENGLQTPEFIEFSINEPPVSMTGQDTTDGFKKKLIINTDDTHHGIKLLSALSNFLTKKDEFDHSNAGINTAIHQLYNAQKDSGNKVGSGQEDFHKELQKTASDITELRKKIEKDNITNIENHICNLKTFNIITQMNHQELSYSEESQNHFKRISTLYDSNRWKPVVNQDEK